MIDHRRILAERRTRGGPTATGLAESICRPSLWEGSFTRGVRADHPGLAVVSVLPVLAMFVLNVAAQPREAAFLQIGKNAAGKPSRLADIGQAPETRLVDSSGQPFGLSTVRGKVVLVSFVYTTCNGVCPATTQTLVQIQRSLLEAKLWKTSVEFVSITLDPKRDTPDVLNRYARLFGADLTAWRFLTGNPEQVGSVIKAWGMWVKSDPSGALDHPSRIFLVDQKGREREIYNLEFLNAPAVLEDVRELVNGER
jgi:protein SCO1/2